VIRFGGTQAVLKLAMPHMEGKHEIQGLRYWSGRSMVKLLEADDDSCRRHNDRDNRLEDAVGAAREESSATASERPSAAKAAACFA
jgi:hypothetical protein